MRRLVVNADGFGFTFGTNRGILEVLEHGFIRSVSVNVTWPAVKDVATLVRDFPQVSVGVHLNLSVGPSILPASEIRSLVGPDGEFHGTSFRRMAMRRAFSQEEMRRELRAQIDVLRQTGVTISHWDSHQSRHLYPGFFEAAMAVTREAGLTRTRSFEYHLVTRPGPRWLRVAEYFARQPRAIVSHRVSARRSRAMRREGMRLTDRRLQFAGMADWLAESWHRLLAQAPAGLSFVVCHPGYVDEDLKQYSVWTEKRELELKLFSDPAWCRRASDAGVEVVDHTAVDAVSAQRPGQVREHD